MDRNKNFGMSFRESLTKEEKICMMINRASGVMKMVNPVGNKP
jgi:hypothetical protein